MNLACPECLFAECLCDSDGLVSVHGSAATAIIVSRICSVQSNSQIVFEHARPIFARIGIPL